MQTLESLDKSKIALSCLASVSLFSTALMAHAEIPYPTAAPHMAQHKTLIDQELNQQREFVAGSIAQSQAILSSLLEQSEAAAATNFGFDPATRDPAAERISDFSGQQSDFIAEYAQGMRLRNAQIAGDFSDHINTRALLFFQTGSLYGVADLELEAPEFDPPIDPPEITVPFPGLTAPVGGFFAILDSNP